MDLHGVEADEMMSLSNQQFLYEQALKADKILNF
jgi:hypothetical protein